MRSIAGVAREYSSKLLSREQRGVLIIASVFLYSGILSGAYLVSEISSVLRSNAVMLSFSFKLLLVYFMITVIFAAGLSAAGFVIIPLCSLLMGFLISFLVYSGINDIAFFLFDVLPFASLLMAGFIIYGAAQIKSSWRLFSRCSQLESLSDLQLDIKLYYFTLAVFALLTSVISGLGYIISFVYRSFF